MKREAGRKKPVSGEKIPISPGRINDNSKESIQAVLNSLGAAPTRHWGQNFLINPGARRRLFELLGAEPGQRVWEIGPGLGCLSTEFLSRGVPLLAIEIDPIYRQYLPRRFEEFREIFRLIQGDVLDPEVWSRAEARAGGRPERLIGNLPYNITGPFLAFLTESGIRPRRSIFTVQKEAAERMIARPGEKNYTGFTLLCRYGFDIRIETRLKPGSFYPPPKVESCMISLKPPACSDQPPEEAKNFNRFIRGLFRFKRKTLRNNLFTSPDPQAPVSPELLADFFSSCGIRPEQRPETIPFDIYKEVFRKTRGLSKPR